MWKLSLSITAFIIGVILLSCNDQSSENYSDWKNYAGTKDGMRYSSLNQIDTSNVAKLTVAWKYSSGDKDSMGRSQIQCNPIIVNDILYGTTPTSKLFALNATTGNQKWIFDPAKEDSLQPENESKNFKIARGVTYWEKGNDKRILYNVGEKLYAINIKDGKPVRTFGNNGFIDISKNLDRDGDYNPYVVNTSPGIVYKNILIVGSRVAESADAAPGHIRAYDIEKGTLKWIFHTIPHPGEFGYETWPDKDAWKKLGGANCWAGMSVDEKRGIVYIPLGSVSGDFYGGIRKGTNLFGNCLLALDATTGKYLWHYQTVHHDLWDRDLPANPNLVTISVKGKKIDAIAQITKQGYIFLLDRVNGKPVFDIVETPVPQNALPGEEPWPTQPIPKLPEPFARQSFTKEDVSDIDKEGSKELLAKFNKVKYNTMFTPPSKEGSWIFPGFDGGGEWGGAAVDPQSSILYVFSSELPWALTMVDVPAKKTSSMGYNLYNRYCVSCHAPDLKGNGSSFPTLVKIEQKLPEKEIVKIIKQGRNMMPAFAQLNDEEIKSLLSYITNKDDKEAVGNNSTKQQNILDEVPYMMTGYNRFLDKNGYPGIKPPWGTLNAVNLSTGKLLWKVPVGEYPELTKKGIPVTGTEGYGGPVVTKGGLVFIAASKDGKIRAFDKVSGKQLWQHDLPAPGFATPATYMIDGVQYLVIACGGGKIGTKSGDEYVAFALKK